MIICKRLVPQDDILQKANPSGLSFAKGRPLQMIICKRPAPPHDHLQDAGNNNKDKEEEKEEEE